MIPALTLLLSLPDVVVGDAVTTDSCLIAPLDDPPRQAMTAQPSPGTVQDDAEVVVTAHKGTARGDPLEVINAGSFAVAQAIDDAVIGPLALTYEHAVPDPIRSGLRNFRYNLHEPVVAVNFLLQGKPGKAAETIGRFAINSTIGVAGLFDMAKRRTFRLPRRRNGFADTLGFYGVRPGPFLFVPLIGPTTARDLAGTIIDHAMLPFSFVKPLRRPVYAVTARVVTVLDKRAEFDGQLQAIRQSDDPYAARRDLYLATRQAEIDHLRGRSVPPETRNHID